MITSIKLRGRAWGRDWTPVFFLDPPTAAGPSNGWGAGRWRGPRPHPRHFTISATEGAILVCVTQSLGSPFQRRRSGTGTGAWPQYFLFWGPRSIRSSANRTRSGRRIAMACRLDLEARPGVPVLRARQARQLRAVLAEQAAGACVKSRLRLGLAGRNRGPRVPRWWDGHAFVTGRGPRWRPRVISRAKGKTSETRAPRRS